MSIDGSKTSNASSSTPIDRKAGSSTFFGSKDVAPSVSFSAKKN